MKTKEQIQKRIEELKTTEDKALFDNDVECAIRVTSIIQNFLWVLEEEN